MTAGTVPAGTANANGAGYASFDFKVQDDGGTANGGVDLDPTANTLRLGARVSQDRARTYANMRYCRP